MRGLSGGSAAWHLEPAVRSVASLDARPDATPKEGEDARAFSLRVVRESILAAAIEGPVVVPYLLPPFYPAVLPGRSPWSQAVSAALERGGVPTRPFFPFISDASYLSARGVPEDRLGAHMPSWGRGYSLPTEAMAALELDVITSAVGPRRARCGGAGERGVGVRAPAGPDRDGRPRDGRALTISSTGSFRTSARRRSPAA